MGEFNELIRASAISMIVVILIASLGCLCAIYPRSKPLLGPEARRAVGELILRLVWPCLTIASIGPVLHVDKLLEGAGLIIWAVILVLSAAAITWCFAKMLNLDPVSTAVFALAGSFGNAASLPLLMIRTLCEQPVVVKQLGEPSECLVSGAAYIMVFVVAWIIILFGVGVPILKLTIRNEKYRKREQSSVEHSSPSLFENPISDAYSASISSKRSVFQPPPLDDLENEETQEKWWHNMKNTLTQSPIIVSCYVGVFIGLVRPLSDALFTGSGFLATIGDTITILGDSYVSLMMLTSGAALYIEPPPPTPPSSENNESEAAIDHGLEPPINSSERNSSSINDKNGANSNLYRDLMKKAGPLLALCFIRLVAVPALGFLLIWRAMKNGLFGSEPLDGLRALVVCVQCAVPSAQSCIVVLATLQYHVLACELAVMYLILYPLSMITLTGWTALALHLVETHIWQTKGVDDEETNIDNEEKRNSRHSGTIPVILGFVFGGLGFLAILSGLFYIYRREWKIKWKNGREEVAKDPVTHDFDDFRFSGVFATELVDLHLKSRRRTQSISKDIKDEFPLCRSTVHVKASSEIEIPTQEEHAVNALLKKEPGVEYTDRQSLMPEFSDLSESYQSNLKKNE